MQKERRSSGWSATSVSLAAIAIILASIALTFAFLYNESQQNLRMQASEISALRSQVSSLTSSNTALQKQIAEAGDTISSLKATVMTLQKDLDSLKSSQEKPPEITSISVTFAELTEAKCGHTDLVITVKNTGTKPIKALFVSLNGHAIDNSIFYLGALPINDTNPLQPSQSAGTSIYDPQANVASVDCNFNTWLLRTATYPLLVTATTLDATTYTYETTVSLKH